MNTHEIIVLTMDSSCTKDDSFDFGDRFIY